MIVNSNKHCQDCSIIGRVRPNLDYINLNQADVLFVTDTFKSLYGKTIPLSAEELEVIYDALDNADYKDLTIEYTASIKCPGVKDTNLNAKAKNACRNHLEETIDVVKPKIVIALGNLAMSMLTKKSGISKYRGEIFDIETTSGFKTKVLTTFHPYAVIVATSQKPLFNIDIKNGLDIVVGNVKKKLAVTYEVITDINQLLYQYNFLTTYEGEIAIDLETENLDFLKSKILTVSLSWGDPGEEKTIVIPINHKESSILEHREDALLFIKKIMENPKSIKLFHNAKFDLKFLLASGINSANVVCTKTLAKIINENRPNRLRDLVKEYFGVVC